MYREAVRWLASGSVQELLEAPRDAPGDASQ
jgi:hypothetical protein